MTNTVAAKPTKIRKTDLTYTIYDTKRYKILKPIHKVQYSADFPKVKKPSEFEVYANVTDVQLRKASTKTLEGQANELLRGMEQEEQERARLFPPVYDRAYVERAKFTITDLYNDIVSIMEWSAVCFLIRLTVFGVDALSTYDQVCQWDYYRAERKKWRKCRYKFCLNMFAIERDNFRGQRPKRSDSRYCCDQCRKADFEATDRYKKYGSYLPVYWYVPQTADHIDKYYESHEQAQPLYKIDRKNAEGKAQAIVKKQPKKRAEKTEFKPFLTVNIATGKVDYPSENPLYKYEGH